MERGAELRCLSGEEIGEKKKGVVAIGEGPRLQKRNKHGMCDIANLISSPVSRFIHLAVALSY